MTVAVCSACTSPQLDALDTDLAGGVPQRVVAKRYSLSLSVVNRHKQAHLPASLVPVTSSEAATLVPGTLLERLEGLAVEVAAYMAMARQAGSIHAGLACVKEARATLELVAKITGQLNERPVVIVNLDTSQEWLAMRTTMLQILHRYPDALAEVRDVLRLEPPA
jgi:hypothetical protein